MIRTSAFLIFNGLLFLSISSIKAYVSSTNQNYANQNYVNEKATLDLIFEENEKGLLVNISFRGEPDGSSELELTKWGGLTHDSESYTELTAVNSNNTQLVVDQIEPGVIKVWHQPAEKVSIRYLLKYNQRQDIENSNSYYRPIINSSVIQLIGYSSLLLPKSYGEFNLNFCWRSVDRAVVFSSIAADQSCNSKTVTKNQLYGALFIAGDFNIQRVDVEGNPLYITLEKTSWKFSFEELVDLATEVTQVERDYFNDHNFPFYWINAIRVGEPIDRGYQFSGTRLVDNFTLFLNPSTYFESDYITGNPIIALLAHEMMHVWTGGKLKASADVPEGEFYWFSEGFTNYLTKRVLLRGGLITEEQFIAGLNETLVNYYDNSAINAMNKQIAENFWTSRAHQTLPYQRGELVAWVIDTMLKPNSSLSQVLSRWMDNPDYSENLTLDSFLHGLSNELTEIQINTIRRFIENGPDESLGKQLTNNCQQVSILDLPTWELGFNSQKSLDAREVIGLKKNSNAYKAGLREGQKIQSLSFEYNQIGKPVDITIAEKDAPISYFPYGESNSYWQLNIKQDNCLQ